jgi:hypothetical protein
MFNLPMELALSEPLHYNYISHNVRTQIHLVKQIMPLIHVVDQGGFPCMSTVALYLIIPRLYRTTNSRHEWHQL